MIYGSTEDGFIRKTYVEILEDMRSKAKELFGDSINLTESSPLGMFIDSIAWEISESWESVENSHFNNFLLYSNGSALDYNAGNFGRKRFKGTKATDLLKLTGGGGTVIPKGFIISTKSELLFETVEEITIGADGAIVEVIATEVGTQYNIPTNTITEIVNPISGLSSVSNINGATGGSDIESDDEFRTRCLEALREPSTGDNIAQYKLWAREIQEVGAVKVLATTPSKGYVTIVIVDIYGKPADVGLISKVESHIGGLKPVNAGLVVKSATSKDITVKATVQLADGYTLLDIKEELETKIINHFKEIALNETYISYAQLGRMMLDSKGLLDYSDLTINNGVSNVALSNTEVPELLLLELIE